MKTLVVEDDFTSRLLLQNILLPWGECHAAVNGKEAISAFHMALDEGQPYDLVCLDIMLPDNNGHETLRAMRALEEGRGIVSTRGAKIVMITALGDIKNISSAYQAFCDGYLVKPVDPATLSNLLNDLGLQKRMGIRGVGV